MKEYPTIELTPEVARIVMSLFAIANSEGLGAGDWGSERDLIKTIIDIYPSLAEKYSYMLKSWKLGGVL